MEPAASSPPLALWLGATEGEFSLPRVALAQRFDVVELSHDSLTAAALERRDFSSEPQWLLIAERYPGEHNREILSALWQRFPLLRVHVVCGSFCEGEKRTGTPWPGCGRSYWHQWALGELPDDLVAGLPVTATEAEVVIHQSRESGRGEASQRVAVRAGSHESRQMLDALLKALGHQVLSGASELEAEIVIWETDHRELHASGVATELLSEFPQARILAWMSFPRWQDEQRAAELGLASIISRPTTWPQWQAHLRNAVQ